MKSRKFYLFFLILFCVGNLQSSISAQTPTPEIIAPKNIPAEPSADSVPISDLIQPGDLIDVDVIGSIEYDWRGTINPEGFLDGIDFVENPIYGLCRNETEIAADIAKAYNKILREPKVVVKVLDRSNRPLVLLYGAIKVPQRLQVKRPLFLNELLIVGGGLTERSSGDIQIFRQQNLNCSQVGKDKSALPIEKEENRSRFVVVSQDNGSNFLNIRINDLLAGRKEANPQILSGDIVTILEAESVYIIGGVVNPKQISFRNQMTLTRAIASAGGIAKSGDSKKITIYRRQTGETKTIEADLEKIKAASSEDLVLQPFDIVEVAQSGRDKSKFPPVLKISSTSERKSENLPLRIID